MGELHREMASFLQVSDRLHIAIFTGEEALFLGQMKVEEAVGLAKYSSCANAYFSCSHL